jgi:hypothetical protein
VVEGPSQSGQTSPESDAAAPADGP